ncbi:MAG: NfeD family protein [Bacteroidales bacterium]|nr:NfeD family protein [Bacteroidales bacterium]
MGLIIALFLIGILLLLLEVFITPGFGLAGILSVASLVYACARVFYEYGLTAGLITTAAVVLLIIFMIVWFVKTKSWNRLALETSIDSKAGQSASEAEPGEEGVTISRLAPLGTARIGDRTMEVKSLAGIIPPNTRIRVEMIENGNICVTEIK